MIVISSPQYVWALFTRPMSTELGVTLAQLQVTFSLLIVLQTFLSPCQGFLVDRFGPRALLSVGAVLTGLSWSLAANAETLGALYLTYGVLGGIGTGIVYIASSDNVQGSLSRGSPPLVTPLRTRDSPLADLGCPADLRYRDPSRSASCSLSSVSCGTGAEGPSRPAEEVVLLRTVAAGDAAGPPADEARPDLWLMFVMMTMMPVGLWHSQKVVFRKT